MRLKSVFVFFVALFIAGPLAAQIPPAPPEPAPDPENVLWLELSTGGTVAIQLRPDVAPQHVARVKSLTRQGFYNGLVFHRVIDGFMAQTGDPKGTGEGGSTLPDIKQEFNAVPHLRGTVSMARTDNPDSANSQFFIMFVPRFGLDKKYTVFGRVMTGMAFVDKIERGEPPANPSRIVRASIAADANRSPDEIRALAAQPAPAPAAPAQAAPAPAPAAPAPEAAPAPAPAPPPAEPAPPASAPAAPAQPQPAPAQ